MFRVGVFVGMYIMFNVDYKNIKIFQTEYRELCSTFAWYAYNGYHTCFLNKTISSFLELVHGLQ